MLPKVLSLKYYLFGIISLLTSLYLLRDLYWPGTQLVADEGCRTPLLEVNSKPIIDIHATPLTRRRVAVASHFGFHFDVYMTLVWSVSRAMKQSTTGGIIEVYAHVPFYHDFQPIATELNLYAGEYREADDLIPSLRSEMGDGGIDTVILGTCEIDLRGDLSQKLLDVWDDRDEDHKFQLVCVVHDTGDENWQPAITQWSLRNAIRLVTISEHVAYSFRNKFRILADDLNFTIRSAGYENIKIDTHVPILPLLNLPKQPPSRVLSKAVIQGSFTNDRRDYEHIFNDLNVSLHDDPAAWGYLPREDQQSFVPSTGVADSPFQLFILGSGTLDVPDVLKNVVTVRTDLSYPEYYDLMAHMDICVPAFAKNGYYERQASSTFAMALQCNVPLLVTGRIRSSYVYAADDRVVVTRPAAMREIDALRALRIRDGSWFLDKRVPDIPRTIGQNPPIKVAVEEMISRGWARPKADFEAFKQALWKRNGALAGRILRDL